jgi:hypothetical protein
MSTDTQISDREFVSDLRTAVDAYLDTVDRWEEAFRKYYRMPGCSEKVSADMEAEQRDYNQRRRELEALLSKARRLCLKHRLRDPLGNLMRVSLGGFAPQQRTDSAIGRGERTAVSVCLMELHEACAEWPAEVPSNTEQKPLNRSLPGRVMGCVMGRLLGRVLNYFY